MFFNFSFCCSSRGTISCIITVTGVIRNGTISSSAAYIVFVLSKSQAVSRHMQKLLRTQRIRPIWANNALQFIEFSSSFSHIIQIITACRTNSYTHTVSKSNIPPRTSSNKCKRCETIYKQVKVFAVHFVCNTFVCSFIQQIQQKEAWKMGLAVVVPMSAVWN